MLTDLEPKLALEGRLAFQARPTLGAYARRLGAQTGLGRKIGLSGEAELGRVRSRIRGQSETVKV